MNNQLYHDQHHNVRQHRLLQIQQNTKAANHKVNDLWLLNVSKLIRKDGVIAALNENAPDDTAIIAAISKFMNKDEKARLSIILNLENGPTTMSTSSLMSGAITLAVWNKLKDTYQTNNIQSKLSLRK